ncbi:MAG: ATP synthase subunit I [Proteobacteria bacterium]|nr:ATP synthase subunit I [Pseudomonadota bacterium]
MDVRGLASAWLLCAAQALTTALSAVIAWVTGGSSAALAALFGGLVAILPALYFALKVAGLGPVAEARRVLGTFYRAEAVKLLLTALLFLIGVRWFGEHFAPLMLTCVACLAMNWVVLAVTANKKA